jgi:hypothetical protein
VERRVSEFWEAVDRAALGLMGTALPRAHALFEPDVPAFGVEEVEVTGDHIESSPSTTASETAQSVTPTLQTEFGQRLPQADAPREDTPLNAIGVRPPQAAEPVFPQPGPVHTPTPTSAPHVRVDEAPDTTREIEHQHVETTRVLEETLIQAVINPQPVEALTIGPPSEPVDVAERDQRYGRDDQHQEPASPVVVVAEPRTSVSEPLGLPLLAQETPLIIEIDRIDIRIEPERLAPPTTSRRQETAPVMSLENYLSSRGEAPR